MVVIADVIKVRDEIKKGEKIEGIIKTYNLLEVGEFPEKSPLWVFEHTYPTTPIRNIIQKINEKLTGKEKRGTFVFTGGYGCGKSHNLVLIYHIFKNLKIAKGWAKEWKIELSIPEGFDVILLPLNYEDFEGQALWNPIFEHLGRKDILEKIEKSKTKCPTIRDLKEALHDKKIVIIIDELEDWYEKLESKEQKRNKDFLKHLFEVSQDLPNLLVFVAIYGRNEDIKDVINRVNPIVEDLTSYPDENKNIILFRIFEIGTLKKDLAEKVIEEYLKAYKKAELDILAEEFKKEMKKTYPFHPEVLRTLFERYTTSRNYQNTRGILFLLTPIVMRTYKERELILLSDLDITLEDISGTLKILNRNLFEKTIFDIKDTEGIPFNKEILSTIFFYSLGEVRNLGATEREVILNILRPGLKVVDIKTSLVKLLRTANHLWPVENRFVLREEERPVVLVERRAQKISLEQAKFVIKNIVHEKILPDIPVILDGIDEMKDDKSIKVVLFLNHPPIEDELDEKIKDLYWGIENRNTILLIVPKKGINLLEIEDVVIKAKRIVAAKEIVNEVEKEKRRDIENFRKKERRELKEAIKNYYGFFIKPLEIKDGRLEYRHEPCELSKSWIKEKIEKLGNKTEIKTKISEVLRSENTIKVGELLNRFYQIPGYPLISSRRKFEECLVELCKEKKLAIILPSGAKRFGEYVAKIDDSATLIFEEYYRKHEKEIEEKKKEEIEEFLEEIKREKPEEKIQIKEVKPVEKIELPPEELLETAANKYSLLDRLERKGLSVNDIAEEVEFELRDVKFEGSDSLDKLEEFIGSINLANVKEAVVKIKIKLPGKYSVDELKEIVNRLPEMESGDIVLKGKVKRK